MGHVVQMSAEDHKVLIASMFALCPGMRSSNRHMNFSDHHNRWNIIIIMIIIIITKKSIEWRGS